MFQGEWGGREVLMLCLMEMFWIEVLPDKVVDDATGSEGGLK